MALAEKNKIIYSNYKNPRIITDLKSIINYFIKLWRLFLIVGILSGAIGFFYAYKNDPAYKSRLSFALDDGNEAGKGNYLNLASQFGITVGGSNKDIFAGDNILKVMKSRRMLEKVLLSADTFNRKPYTLIEYFLNNANRGQYNSKIKNIHFPVGQLRSTFSYQQDSLLYVTSIKFANDYIVTGKPDITLSIYEVSVTSPNEKFTKVFTDRIVTETNKFYIEIRTKKAKETLNILEQRVATMKRNLTSSTANGAEVKDANINPAFSAAQVPVIKQRSNIQVYSNAYAEMFKNLELARFQYLNEMPIMQIIDAADYPMEKIKMGKCKAVLLFTFFAELLLLMILIMRMIFGK